MTDPASEEPGWLREPSTSPNDLKALQNLAVNEKATEPSWLAGTPIKQTNSKPSVTGGKKVETRHSVLWKNPGKNSEANEEDCCCCPLDPILYWFRIFHVLTGLIGFVAMITNIYALTFGNIYNVIERCYAIVFCAMVVLIELEWQVVTARLKIMDLWIFRGFFFSFVGFITGRFISLFLS